MDDELIYEASRFFRRNKLKHKSIELKLGLKQAEKLVDLVTRWAQGELEDVEMLKQNGLVGIFHRLRGTFEEKIAAEEKEMQYAFSRLQVESENLHKLKTEYEKITNELIAHSNVDSRLPLATLKSKNPDSSNHSKIAFRTGRTLIDLSEVEERIELSQKVELRLRGLQNELSKFGNDIYAMKREAQYPIYVKNINKHLVESKIYLDQIGANILASKVEALIDKATPNMPFVHPSLEKVSIKTMLSATKKIHQSIVEYSNLLIGKRETLQNELIQLEEQWDSIKNISEDEGSLHG